MGEAVNTNISNLYVNIDGKYIDLSKLDQLVGTSTKGSIFKAFDKKSHGGNKNKIFDLAEINAIKEYLTTELAKADGKISKKDQKMLDSLVADYDNLVSNQEYAEDNPKNTTSVIADEPKAEIISEDVNGNNSETVVSTPVQNEDKPKDDVNGNQNVTSSPNEEPKDEAQPIKDNNTNKGKTVVSDPQKDAKQNGTDVEVATTADRVAIENPDEYVNVKSYHVDGGEVESDSKAYNEDGDEDESGSKAYPKAVEEPSDKKKEEPQNTATAPKSSTTTSKNDDIVILKQHHHSTKVHTSSTSTTKTTKATKTKPATTTKETKTKPSTTKQPVEYPKPIKDKLNYLKKYGETCTVKFNNGTYTITAKGGPLKSQFQTNYMTYNYDSKGNLIAQYKFKIDGSVDKGVYNKQTKKIEYKQYKNSEGILQLVPANVQKRVNEIRAAGGEATITKGKSTFTIKQTKGSYLTQHKIKSIEIKYSPNGQLIEQITTRTSGEVDKSTFQYNKKVSTKAIKSANSVPDNVMKQYNNLKAKVGDKVQLKKNSDGTYTVYETDNKISYMTKNKLKSISFVYAHDGTFMYQLNALQGSERVLKGVYNSDTKKVEYSEYKNASGILQQIPDSVKQKRLEMQQDGSKTELIKGKSTFVITQTGGQYLEKNSLAKIEHKYSPQGKLLQQIYTYKNGRTEIYYDAATKGADAAHSASPISLELPAQYKGEDTDNEQMIYGLETKGPKDTAKRFSESISSNKAKLMKSLHLTNEEYDNLAVLAMGIAEQETHFGQKEYVDTNGDSHSQDGLLDRANLKLKLNEHEDSDAERAKHSQGITQIRYAVAIKDPIVAKRFKENGITSFRDFLKSPEKQAIATMILLNENRKVASSPAWQARLQQNNAKVKNTKDKLTTNDITVLLWNGAGGVVTRMNNGETITINSETKYYDATGKEIHPSDLKIKATTLAKQASSRMEDGSVKDAIKDNTKDIVSRTGMFYAYAVRSYSGKFFTTSENGKAGAMHLAQTTETAGATGGNGQENGGQLGEVVFMPTNYKYRNYWRISSTTQQTKDAMTYIDANTKLSQKSKNLLKGYIKDGIIGFGNQGLTKSEAASITENDFKLMKKQIDAIKMGKVTANQANTNFESEYLKSRQFTVRNTAVSSSSILSQTTSSNPRNEKIGGISFEVNKAFYNGKEHTTNYVTFDNSDNSNVFAVTKSKGVNPYLSNGEMVDEKYRISAEHAEYTATHVLESGGRCKTGVAIDLEYSMGIDHTKIRGKGGKSIPHAKQMAEFYSAHPEVFTQIKYVDNGDGTSRELNATDIHDLPCGYYGVFIPGKGYENESGHAFVTDGFGECNADEHDNGNWTHFGNGKGEHGKLKVFGLSENVVSVDSKKLGRKVNVPLNLNPWYLTPEFRELQNEVRKMKGLEPLKPVKEFDV